MDKQRVIDALKSSYGISILLHIGIVLFLVLSVSFAAKTPAVTADAGEMPEIVKATFIDPAVTQAKYDQEQAQKRAAEQQRQKRLQREKAAREKRDAERKRKALAKKAAEKKKQAEAKKKQAEAKKKRELARKAEEALAQKKAAEAKEQKRKQAEAAEQKRLAQQQEQLEEALRQEQAEIAAAQRKRVVSEKQRYSALIKATIQRNLIVNDAFKGKKCLLNIRLGIGGVVLKVNQLSGDDALCRAAINAVYKPTNLPVSRDPAVFAELRDINLTVEQ